MNLKKQYNQEIKNYLLKELGLGNINEVPKLEKIVINMTSKDAVENKKTIDSLKEQLLLITGQMPIVSKAKKSISTFKLRKGMDIGVKVTLRNDMMYNFLEKLIVFIFPRIRDFRGFSPKAFDGKGNYTLGMKEQIIFPEINYEKFSKIYGLNISFITSAKNNNEGFQLLKQLGIPFKE